MSSPSKRRTRRGYCYAAQDADLGCEPGYLNPIEDARVELHDGSYHDVDSTKAAFRIAASGAAADAARKAQPVLLEPVMTLEADVHVEAADDVMRNIESRRGDGSRDSLVRAPLKPSPPLRHASVALPEPDEDGPEN
jgi:hypothetical protein